MEAFWIGFYGQRGPKRVWMRGASGQTVATVPDGRHRTGNQQFAFSVRDYTLVVAGDGPPSTPFGVAGHKGRGLRAFARHDGVANGSRFANMRTIDGQRNFLRSRPGGLRCGMVTATAFPTGLTILP